MMILALRSLYFILKPWALEMAAQRSFIFNPMGITGLPLAGLVALLPYEGVTIFVKAVREKAETLDVTGRK